MSSITPTQAGLFSGPFIPNRYYYDCRPTDQFFDILDFHPIAGKELQLNVIGASSTGLASYAAAVAAGGALAGTMPTIDSRTYELKRIAAELPIDSSLLGIYGSQNDLLQALLSMMAAAIRDKAKSLLVVGDSASNSAEFDGMSVMATAFGNTLTASGGGGVVDAGQIEELLAMLNPRKTDGSTYLVMHAKAYMQLLKHNYTVTEINDQGLSVIAGAPVLVDNFIPTDEGTGNDTSIYAVIVGKDKGLCGIYAAADEGQPIQVRGPVVKEDADTQWYHVSWNCSLACYNKCSVAQLNGVTTTA